MSAGDNGATGLVSFERSHVLVPDYPATSAHVTAVGATQLTSYAGSECGSLDVLTNTCVGERVCSTSTGALITSGGGYSTAVPPLAIMKDAVATYARRAHNLPPPKTYASDGRAYPDVAALGHNYLIVLDKGDSAAELAPVDGTSASSPVFAGVVALVAANAHAVDGTTGLGDIKPLLYSDEALTSGVFGDVTLGDNTCRSQNLSVTSPCMGPGACLWRTAAPSSSASLTVTRARASPGFDAVAGWDPATGLGTVRFPALRSLLVRGAATPPPSSDDGDVDDDDTVVIHPGGDTGRRRFCAERCRSWARLPPAATPGGQGRHHGPTHVERAPLPSWQVSFTWLQNQ